MTRCVCACLRLCARASQKQGPVPCVVRGVTHVHMFARAFVCLVSACVCVHTQQLYKKWSSVKRKGAKREKSVDFKEFSEMLKSLNLKVGKHKALEIFRQVGELQIRVSNFYT